ncbi:MAG TPA: FeoA family protein [Thermoanaerobaculia bacterium]|nr:FeoA family protein [Thermoanaerobaculia bacterium]
MTSGSDQLRALSQLIPGERGVVVRVDPHVQDRFDRLAALGVTPGVSVTVLQVFPGIVFLCDQTELVVERDVAAAIQIRIARGNSGV